MAWNKAVIGKLMHEYNTFLFYTDASEKETS